MLKIYLTKIIRIILKLLFGFDYWHTSPKENRDYILYANKIIKLKKNKKNIADIGCGIGDISYNLESSYVDYYDKSKEVLKYLKIRNFLKKNKNFYQFDFTLDKLLKQYDVIILLNFTHNIIEETLHKKILEFFKVNLKKNGFLILDVIEQNKNYKYNHKLNLFFENNKMKRVFISKKMRFNRRIIVVMKN